MRTQKYLFLLYMTLFYVVRIHGTPETHSVKPGESVSLICIEYYGRYSESMGKLIKEINPEISDINSIPSGFKLKLLPEKEKTEITKKEIPAARGVVTFLEGEVTLVSPSGESEPLDLNTVIDQGSSVETGENARAEILINTESVIRIGPSSILSLTAFKDPGNKKSVTEIKMEKGNLWTKVRKGVSKLRSFSLMIPNAVAGVYGTVYDTEVKGDQSSSVKVYNGEVRLKQRSGTGTGNRSLAVEEVPGPHEVSMEEWTRIIRKMQMVEITSDGKPSEVKSFQEGPDEGWADWNVERDKMLEGIISKE